MSVETGHPLYFRPRQVGAVVAVAVLAMVAGSMAAGSRDAQAQMAPAQADVPPAQLQNRPIDNPAPSPMSPPGPVASPTAEPAPPSAFRPGFLDVFGRWIEGSISDINAGLSTAKGTLDAGISGAKGTLDKAGDVAKGAAGTAAGAAADAAGAIGKLPVGRMVDGREKCAVAANGSPDCYTAATQICKAKGYAEGKSVDTNTAQKCSARVWISGRSPREGECATETYVIRAVCQ